MSGITFAAVFALLLLSVKLANSGSSNYFVSDNEPSDTNADSADVPLDGDNEMGLQQKIQAMMRAIAFAEGFYKADGSINYGAVPVRANNPCDLKVGDVGNGTINGITVFSNVSDGWARAQHQVTLMLTGKSRVYSYSDSWLEVAAKFAGGDLNWGLNTAAVLGVSPDSTLGDFVNS